MKINIRKIIKEEVRKIKSVKEAFSKIGQNNKDKIQKLLDNNKTVFVLYQKEQYYVDKEEFNPTEDWPYFYGIDQDGNEKEIPIGACGILNID